MARSCYFETFRGAFIDAIFLSQQAYFLISVSFSDQFYDINEGDFVSFIGPSGCGKTTFLRVLADLEKPTSGTVQINGVTPTVARESRAYGYVFQAPGLYPWRTIGLSLIHI